MLHLYVIYYVAMCNNTNLNLKPQAGSYALPLSLEPLHNFLGVLSIFLFSNKVYDYYFLLKPPGGF